MRAKKGRRLLVCSCFVSPFRYISLFFLSVRSSVHQEQRKRHQLKGKQRGSFMVWEINMGVCPRLEFDNIMFINWLGYELMLKSSLFILFCKTGADFHQMATFIFWLAVYSSHTVSFLDLTYSYRTLFYDTFDMTLLHLILVTAPKCGYSSSVGM